MAIDPTLDLAEQRNQTVASLADEIYFAHITTGGRTSRLLKQIEKWGVPIVENS